MNFFRVNRTILLMVILFLVGLIVFWKSFFLGIYGDEWKIFWLAESSVNNTGKIIPASDSSYGFEIFVYYWMSKIFGYGGVVYYFFSFICRYGAAVSVFWFLKRKQTSITAFLGALIFIVSPIGIETTDWARNFDSYLGIVLFLICSDAVLRLKNWGGVVTVGFSFALAALVNSIRSHGFLLAILTLLLYLFIVGNKKIKKFSTILAVTVSATFLVFALLNVFGGQINMTVFEEGFQPIEQIKSLLGGFGNSFVPNIIVKGINFQLVGFWISLLLILLWKSETFFRPRIGRIFSLFNVLILIGLSFFSIAYPLYFRVSIFIGIYFFVLIFIALIDELLRKDYIKVEESCLVLVCGFLFMLMPTIRQPGFHPGYDHRYMIFSALVVPLIVAFSLKKCFQQSQRIWQYVAVILSVTVLVGFSIESINYFQQQNKSHPEAYSQRIWKNILTTLNNYDFQKRRLGIIIVSDLPTSQKLGSSVQFGFGFHLALLRHVYDEEKIPFLINDDKKIVEQLSILGDLSGKYYKQKTIIRKQDIVVLTIYGDQVSIIPLDDFLANKDLQNANH